MLPDPFCGATRRLRVALRFSLSCRPSSRSSVQPRGLCAVALLLALASAAAAQSTLTVTTLADSNDGSCAATCSLRDAITAAASGDTIVFQQGLTGTVTLSSTLAITQNLTVQGPGAAHLTISGNSAVPVFTIGSADVHISGLTIADGLGASAGGIVNAGALALSAVQFSGNAATSTHAGGAIFNNSGATLTVNNSSFTGNMALATGAAAAVFNSAGATLTITSSTFSANASAHGAAAVASNGNLTVIGSTFARNSGAGVLTGSGALSVVNSILASDTGGECVSTSGCPTSGSSGNLVGVGNIALTPLGNYGGGTQTLMPLPGSPAICAGSASQVPAGLSSDQRGFPLISSCVDAGAVQTNYVTVTTTNDSGSGSLRSALTTANAAGFADIDFSATGTIQLATTLPALTGQAAVIGPGASRLTISGSSPDVQGLVLNAGAQATVYGLTIANGNGHVGGAIDNEGGTLAVIDSAFTGNSASSGGAIASSGSLTVSNSFFSANSAPDCGSGGAIFNNSGTGLVVGSTFLNNSAPCPAVLGGRGGAIFNYLGAFTITGSTFAGNSAVNGNGGAILNGGSLTMASSTVSGNSASEGSGLWSDVTATLINSIVAGNTGSDVDGDDCYDCGTQSANNLISTPGNVVAPQLSPAQVNGAAGVLSTMIPLPGSPAICAGLATALAAGTTTDQRGFPRLNTTYTGYSAGHPCLDFGAVQTNYSAVQFVVQPSYTAVNTAITPSPALEILETNTATGARDAVNGVSLTVAYSGGATEIAGALTAATTAGAATFSGLVPNTIGTGFVLSSSTPVLAGTTLTAASNPFDVSPALVVSLAALPSAMVGAGYPAQTLTVPNGTAPYTWAVTSGALPTGLHLSTAGLLSGTPTAAGSFSFTITARDAHNISGSQAGTLTVAKAGTTTALQLSATSLKPGSDLTLTAQVTAATSGMPTGSVSFYSGATLLHTVTLSGGSASYSTTALAAGATDSLTATYSGDANFEASTASAQSVVVAPLDFSLAVSGSASQSVVPGTPATFQLAVTPTYGAYPGPVTFTADGLPAGAAAKFSPATIAAASGEQTVTVTIQTAAPSTAAIERDPAAKIHSFAWAFLLLPLLGAGSMRRNGRFLRRTLGNLGCLLLLSLAALAAGTALTGCGSSSVAFPPAQSYTVTLTGTSGTVAHAATVTLSVE